LPLPLVLFEKRVNAADCVLKTSGIAEQGECSGGRVLVAGGVLRERIGTNGRVVFAGSVLPERIGTNGRVVTCSGVVSDFPCAFCADFEAVPPCPLFLSLCFPARTSARVRPI
jgi:hypothetical protein